MHALSRRVDGPFVKLNCSAIPENLVESELFGHVKGAFSGADRDRPGRFFTANGGTLLLDEVGDMPMSAQTRLLRVLQEGTFEPVGSDRTVKVDVRVIAATHVNLEEAVASRRFRQDLYYRLSVFPIRLPPLRERREDIAPIAEAALEERRRRGGGGPWVLSPEARQALTAQPWPGNVRELLSAVERATILCPSGVVEPRHLGLAPAAALPAPLAPSEDLPSWEENERRYWQAVLAKTEGRIYGPGGAAEIAGMKPTTLRSRLVNLGLR